MYACYKQTNSKLVSMFSLVGGCGVLISIWLPVILQLAPSDPLKLQSRPSVAVINCNNSPKKESPRILSWTTLHF